jgi:hypothetical protein
MLIDNPWFNLEVRVCMHVFICGYVQKGFIMVSC